MILNDTFSRVSPTCDVSPATLVCSSGGRGQVHSTEVERNPRGLVTQTAKKANMKAGSYPASGNTCCQKGGDSVSCSPLDPEAMFSVSKQRSMIWES